MKRINEEKILRIWSLILLWRGRSKYRRDFPILRISDDPHKREPRGTYKLAEYDPKSNVVTVWWKKHSHFKELTSTLLHEYTHYLQFWPWYSRYSNIHKYANNPYELQARESELDTPIFLGWVSDKSWKIIMKKEPKLFRIYESVSGTILVNR